MIFGIQNIPAGALKCRDIVYQRIPNGANIDRTIGVHIKVSGVLDDPPGDGAILRLDFIGKLGYQLTDLHDAHTTGVLKHMVRFKGRKVVLIAREIIGDPLAIGVDFLKDDLITGFDRAAPPRP